MNKQQFDQKLHELKEKFAIPAVVEVNFTQKALTNFCIDLADFINGFLPFLNEKFEAFYQSISCTISGDKIHQVFVESREDCPNLHPSFEQLDPPASIRLRFKLDNPLATGWLAVHKDLYIHFRVGNFEVVYNNPTGEPQPYQRNYNFNFLDISEQLLDRLSDDMLTTILSRHNNP
jgi:hypothetical protein